MPAHRWLPGCAAPPPACPTGTTPGIKELCWTGYCIPNSDCGPNDPGECFGDVSCLMLDGLLHPRPSVRGRPCETLATEQACAARGDCSPIYQGTNCECPANGCTCETLSYEPVMPAGAGGGYGRLAPGEFGLPNMSPIRGEITSQRA